MSIPGFLCFDILLTSAIRLRGFYTVSPPTSAILQDNRPISRTLTFGSLIGGANTPGGAAVEFPIFSKVLQIQPDNARTFSLAVQ